MFSIDFVTILIGVVVCTIIFSVIKKIKRNIKAKELAMIEEDFETFTGGEEDFFTLQEFFSPENSLHREERDMWREKAQKNAEKEYKKAKKRTFKKKKYEEELEEELATLSAKEVVPEYVKPSTKLLETGEIIMNAVTDIMNDKAAENKNEVIYKKQSEYKEEKKSTLIKTDLFLAFEENNKKTIRPAFSYSSLNGYRMLYDIDLNLKRNKLVEVFTDKNNSSNSFTYYNSELELVDLVESLIDKYNVNIDNVFKTNVGKNDNEAIGMITRDDNSILAIYCLNFNNQSSAIELRFAKESSVLWANRFKAMINSIEFDESMRLK